jgi:hypothetical protein
MREPRGSSCNFETAGPARPVPVPRGWCITAVPKVRGSLRGAVCGLGRLARGTSWVCRVPSTRSAGNKPARACFRGVSRSFPDGTCACPGPLLSLPDSESTAQPGVPGFGALGPGPGHGPAGFPDISGVGIPAAAPRAEAVDYLSYCRRKSPHSPGCRLSWSTAWSTAWSQLSVEATKEALPIVLGASDTSAASHTPGRSKLPSAVGNAAGLARADCCPCLPT